MWRKNNNLFSPKITIPDLGIEIKSCKLAHGGLVSLTKEESGYAVEFDVQEIQPVNTIIELEYADNIMGAEPVEISANSLSYNKPLPTSSNPKGHWSNHHWVELRAVTNGKPFIKEQTLAQNQKLNFRK